MSIFLKKKKLGSNGLICSATFERLARLYGRRARRRCRRRRLVKACERARGIQAQAAN